MSKMEDLHAARTLWKSQLLLTATHTPKPLLANAVIALRNAPEWERVLAYDEFALTTLAVRPPPYAAGANRWEACPWTDRDDVLTAVWLQHQGICVSEKIAASAAITVAKDAAFHPIKDYLGGLRWDGKPRLEGFTVTYLGAEDTLYHRSAGQCFLISAVARIMQPGCQADHVLILEGAQGIGKSTALRTLFEPWFTDDIAELGSNDAAMQVRSAWCIELSELASMARTDTEKVKSFISRRIDRFRPSYGRHVINAPRESVLAGSSNADAYLKDETGARRDWPIKCGRIKLKTLKRDRDQLWAEAIELYHAGENWWFDTPELEEAARKEQASRRVEDAWEARIEDYIADKDVVTIGEILEELLQIEASRWSPSEQYRVSRCLTALGWRRGWQGHQRCYRPDPTQTQT